MPLPKTAPWALDFAKFIEDSAKLDYADLGQHFRDSDWKFRLVQRSAIPTPDGATLVDTDILIGPGYDKLEHFDTVTFKLPPNIAPVTSLVRQNLTVSLLAVVFGRFPPEPMLVPQPQPGQMNGGDAFPVPPMDGGEYVDEEPAAPSVNVVAKREPDGLPIFVDLYALGDRSEDVINAILDEVQNFLALAGSIEQIDAVALKNPDMVAFVKDLGTAEDRAELSQSINARRRELTVPAAAAAANAPRRRARVPQAN